MRFFKLFFVFRIRLVLKNKYSRAAASPGVPVAQPQFRLDVCTHIVSPPVWGVSYSVLEFVSNLMYHTILGTVDSVPVVHDKSSSKLRYANDS